MILLIKYSIQTLRLTIINILNRRNQRKPVNAILNLVAIHLLKHIKRVAYVNSLQNKTSSFEEAADISSRTNPIVT